MTIWAMDFDFNFKVDFGISEMDFDVQRGLRTNSDLSFNVNSVE